MILFKPAKEESNFLIKRGLAVIVFSISLLSLGVYTAEMVIDSQEQSNPLILFAYLLCMPIVLMPACGIIMGAFYAIKGCLQKSAKQTNDMGER